MVCKMSLWFLRSQRLHFLRWSRNIQVLLDDGSGIIIPRGNVLFLFEKKLSWLVPLVDSLKVLLHYSLASLEDEASGQAAYFLWIAKNRGRLNNSQCLTLRLWTACKCFHLGLRSEAESSPITPVPVTDESECTPITQEEVQQGAQQEQHEETELQPLGRTHWLMINFHLSRLMI